MKNLRKSKKIIVIVCRGNITRSPFAEGVINKELTRRNLDAKYLAISRGTQGTRVDPVPVKHTNITFYKEEYRFSKPTLDKFQINIIDNVSKPIDKKIAEKASLILAVDERNKTALFKLFPNFKNKIHKISKLTNENEDFKDPEVIKGAKKHFQILSGLNNTILEGFSNLLTLANKSEKN